MAIISLEIGAADEPRILDGFAKAYGPPEGADPETWVPDFVYVGGHLANFMTSVVLGVEANDAANVARDDALTNTIDVDVTA